MLSRRAFLVGSASLFVAAGCDPMTLARRLSRGCTGQPNPSWSIPGAAASDSALSVVYSGNAFSVVVGGVTVEQGWRPASAYNNLWTRDNAYTLWHNPGLQSATLRRQFVTQTLAYRSVANFLPDHVSSGGSVSYNGGGQPSYYPILDGIAMVVLALWTDWNATGDTTTFTSQQSIIDDCLAAIPRDANGCVYSDPANPSVDYGFTDSVLKTGDVAYGTALQAWAYKMCGQMSGGGNSTNPAGTSYGSLQAAASAGLATLYNSTSGFYRGSSGNNSAVDDVWATALAVAENLDATNRTTAATAMRSAYLAGNISQLGRVRHLPVGQYWTNCTASAGTYQNGGFWVTPLWDCVRAVAVVDFATARAWATEAMNEIANDEIAVYGAAASPNEWLNWPYGSVGGAPGYTPSAAVVHRFI